MAVKGCAGHGSDPGKLLYRQFSIQIALDVFQNLNNGAVGAGDGCGIGRPVHLFMELHAKITDQMQSQDILIHELFGVVGGSDPVNILKGCLKFFVIQVQKILVGSCLPKLGLNIKQSSEAGNGLQFFLIARNKILCSLKD